MVLFIIVLHVAWQPGMASISEPLKGEGASHTLGRPHFLRTHDIPIDPSACADPGLPLGSCLTRFGNRPQARYNQNCCVKEAS